MSKESLKKIKDIVFESSSIHNEIICNNLEFTQKEKERVNFSSFLSYMKNW